MKYAPYVRARLAAGKVFLRLVTVHHLELILIPSAVQVQEALASYHSPGATSINNRPTGILHACIDCEVNEHHTWMSMEGWTMGEFFLQRYQGYIEMHYLITA